MRVKVGDTWYEAALGQPIMVQLTDADKQNIRNMLPTAGRYAVFEDDDPAYPKSSDRVAWMNEGK